MGGVIEEGLCVQNWGWVAIEGERRRRMSEK
jgi:hypothetical protein